MRVKVPGKASAVHDKPAEAVPITSLCLSPDPTSGPPDVGHRMKQLRQIGVAGGEDLQTSL